jgi:hypothetical protein
MNVCLCIVFVAQCLGCGLVTRTSPVRGVLVTVYSEPQRLKSGYNHWKNSFRYVKTHNRLFNLVRAQLCGSMVKVVHCRILRVYICIYIYIYIYIYYTAGKQNVNLVQGAYITATSLCLSPKHLQVKQPTAAEGIRRRMPHERLPKLHTSRRK